MEDVEDLPESSEPAAAEESPLFSLHAIAGVRFTDTMQLGVDLGGTSLIALLDSGSSHNFISESAAQRTGLPLQRRPRLTATVRTVNVCLASASSARPQSPSTATSSTPIFLSCRLQVMTWCWAHSGWRRWALSYGILAPEP